MPPKAGSHFRKSDSMQIESGRATRKEIIAEVQNRMRILKMNQRMFRHFQAGEIFCSDIWEVFPLQEEYKPILERISRDVTGKERFVPYHAVYKESSKNGRLLHVLYVSTDKDDWEWSRKQVLSLEIPCITIFLDYAYKYVKDSILVISLAVDALEYSALPFIEAEAEEIDGLFSSLIFWCRRFFREHFGRSAYTG